MYAMGPRRSPACAAAPMRAATFKGLEQGTAYNELGLRPEEYAVLTAVAEYQEKQVKQARQVMRVA